MNRFIIVALLLIVVVSRWIGKIIMRFEAGVYSIDLSADPEKRAIRQQNREADAEKPTLEGSICRHLALVFNKKGRR